MALDILNINGHLKRSEVVMKDLWAPFCMGPFIAISGGIEIKDSPIQWDGDLLVTSLVAAQL